jgi:hypothetical protein
MVFGLLYQLLGLGLCAPLYLLAHVLTSPTASAPAIENLSIPKSALMSILPAVTIGMVLPTVAMSLPTPSYLVLETKANLVLLWQLFPVWTSLLCMGFSYTLGSIQIPLRHSVMLRVTYGSVIALSSIAHISSLTLSITPLLAPTIFNPTYSQGLVDAYLTFPPWPTTSP